MTKLIAVNFVARRVLGVTFAATDTGGHSAASDIERGIDEQSTLLQTRGWAFNTFPEVTLTPNGSNNVLIASDVLKGWPDQNDQDAGLNLQITNGMLYDMDNLTFTITQSVSMTLIKEIAFTQLPEVFAQWIVASAACRYNEQRGFREKQATLDREETKAKHEAQRFHTQARHTSVLDTRAARALRGRRNPRRW